MKKWLVSLLVCLGMVGCVSKGPVVTPVLPFNFDLAGCSDQVVDNYCNGPSGLTFTITPQGVSDNPRVEKGDSNGYVFIGNIPGTWKSVNLDITGDGIVPYHQEGMSSQVLVQNNSEGRHNFLPLTPSHVDPSGIPLEELAAIRGAMWPQAGIQVPDLPFGPRPGTPENIMATDFIACYAPSDRMRIIQELKRRGYTHVVMGPLVDSDGYHGQYCVHDWRNDWDTFLDMAQLFWDNGLKPIVFIHPDGWSLADTKTLTPLLAQPRAQKLLRIVVPSGWEPTKYGWSSCTWAGYAQWARETLPNALVLIHTVSDVDAPVGTDSLCDDNNKPNGAGWSRVAPFIHGWLVQNGPYRSSPSQDPSLARNFAAQFMENGDGATLHGIVWHFAHGIDGWPTTSAWGNQRIRVYNGENTAYSGYWQNMPEDSRTPWGDLAVQSGADGYLDGGTVPVPVKR